MGSVRKICRSCSSTSSTRKPTSRAEPVKSRATSLDRTFGSEKRKIDLATSDKRLIKSPELVSPTEVKKASVLTPKSTTKHSRAVLASVRNGLMSPSRSYDIPIKVSISEKGKELLQNMGAKSLRTRSDSASPAPSQASDKSKLSRSTTSLDSVKISKTKKVDKSASLRKSYSTKSVNLKPTVSKENICLLKKAKKDKLNDEIVKKEKKQPKSKSKEAGVKCAGKAAGSELVKKMRNLDFEDSTRTPITLTEIKRQKESLETNNFFQNLFLRDQPIPRTMTFSNNSWITEKTLALQRRTSSISEPTIGALKIYLNHTKPVSDSKFKTMDNQLVRSRSVSPKNVRWEDEKGAQNLGPRMFCTRGALPNDQTSFPDGGSLRRSIEDLPETVIRSPSYRKIQSLHGESLDFIKRRIPRSRSAGEADDKHFKIDLLNSDPPSLTQSTSSIDSLKEYQSYVKEIIYSTKKSDRFKDLSKFYSTIERLGELEKTTSSTDLRPRRKNEEEIIDYDRWREVRQREKAEKELSTIYRELKQTQKEKDFLFMPKQVEAYKWKKDFDWGLRIKEKSVEDIKDEFERLKIKKTNLQDLEYAKDVYKPLWRGNSVVNLAQNMVEKRSQSEGRGVTARQKKIESERLLTHGIGSRIWSSLSMEQVNVLKNQLAEIYQNGAKKKPEYIVEVPEDRKFAAETLLKVRRNSDSSKLWKLLKGGRSKFLKMFP
ncbi:hypothetical protein MML48_6g00020043 [Holotrichia oblita]|uniref:Uncharacterized protein n=1 Tax=Holotrichia oblita TaxID=644536 RepID=A0ACB9T0F5_HOLOL|nr:hypothetical protein MML48_6g00020043 [Holotrichia oblita]